MKENVSGCFFSEHSVELHWYGTSTRYEDSASQRFVPVDKTTLSHSGQQSSVHERTICVVEIDL